MNYLKKAVEIQRFFDQAPSEVAELVFGLARESLRDRRKADAPEKPPSGKKRGRPRKNPLPVPTETEIPVQ